MEFALAFSLPRQGKSELGCGWGMAGMVEVRLGQRRGAGGRMRIRLAGAVEVEKRTVERWGAGEGESRDRRRGIGVVEGWGKEIGAGVGWRNRSRLEWG
ncbi:hypothetical protein ACH5RR_023519 [Cinchona calisaya]|uniref:Uncharacterized protein n=1 Tax=Cinchona calisaya TaxID=153742 RepID=A0ABD2ZET5_9GENT